MKYLFSKNKLIAILISILIISIVDLYLFFFIGQTTTATR